MKCFGGFNLLWHLLAFILTYIIVTSGFDWLYFKSSRSSLLRSLLFPAVRLGSLLPVITPLALYAIGKVRKSLKAIYSAYALGQTAIVGLLISSFYSYYLGLLGFTVKLPGQRAAP